MSPVNRRQILKDASIGFGMMAFSSLAARMSHAQPLAHYAARAKHVILCFMDGGPSHVDTFDPKPELTRQEGKAIGTENVSVLSQSAASRVCWENVGSHANEQRAVCQSVTYFPTSHP